ncbi:hypothetical protein UY3_16006 [Chelonia mydas]|uniref:Uncharacterized protein n=1 Tax=Chelonia mydas TaxID=8469 RepID=M7AQP7_CHEMY|nr:hypothetical protein UY3_16006 [Chelonia mydas]
MCWLNINFLIEIENKFTPGSSHFTRKRQRVPRYSTTHPPPLYFGVRAKHSTLEKELKGSGRASARWGTSGTIRLLCARAHTTRRCYRKSLIDGTGTYRHLKWSTHRDMHLKEPELLHKKCIKCINSAECFHSTEARVDFRSVALWVAIPQFPQSPLPIGILG